MAAFCALTILELLSVSGFQQQSDHTRSVEAKQLDDSIGDTRWRLSSVADRHQSIMDIGAWSGASWVAARHEDFLMTTPPLVSVVDDDESVLESLPDLLKEFGFAAQTFSSAEKFLASKYVGQTRCLILDIAVPGMSGPTLQRELKLRRLEIPIVFITAHRDETVRIRMLEQGAAECLFKPFSDTALLEALNAALRVS
jgi:CheY-like chemotaxis protein